MDQAPAHISSAGADTDYGRIGRIAIVCHSHPSLSKGGAEIAAYTLFNGLVALGLDVIFVTACAEADRARLALGSARERAVYYEPALYDHLYHLASPTVVGQLVALMHVEGVALVNFQHFFHFGIGAVRALAMDARVRTVLTLHEFLAICYNHGQMITRPAHLLCERSSPAACATCFPDNTRQQFALRRDLFHAAFAQVDGFVSPSRFLADRFAAWGLASDRIAIIENGLAHRPSIAPAAPRGESGPWVFGFFGQINPFKGVDTILNAVGLIARDKALAARIQIRLHGNIIGQSEAFSVRFHKLVSKHGFLSYAGAYDNSSVARLMAECHYIMVPSSWWENSPVVIQEAFGVGRPVICTGIGGMAEKVQDGRSGLHFRRGDSADLVRVIGSAADAAVYEKLAAGVPGVSEAREMAEAYLGVFLSAMGLAPLQGAKIGPGLGSRRRFGNG